MQVLVADDDRLCARILATTLKQWGHEVIVAADGAEAWELLRTRRPPIAILDWMMPHCDGLELCRRIRGDPSLAPTYVMLLSARESRTDLVAGLEAGADDYIRKPFERDELHARVQVGVRAVEAARRAAGADAWSDGPFQAGGRAPGSIASDAGDLMRTLGENLRLLSDGAAALRARVAAAAGEMGAGSAERLRLELHDAVLQALDGVGRATAALEQVSPSGGGAEPPRGAGSQRSAPEPERSLPEPSVASSKPLQPGAA